MSKKISTVYPGVRYREHKTKKFQGKPDKYFMIRYRVMGKPKEEGVGWASEGWNAKKVSIELHNLKKAHTTGDGPQTLGEKRKIASEERKLKKIEKEKVEKENTKINDFFDDIFFPNSKKDIASESSRKEESLFKNWISPVIGNKKFSEVREAHFEKIKDNMGKVSRKPRTIKYAFIVSKKFWKYAQKKGYTNREFPADDIRKKIEIGDNKRFRYLEKSEAKELLENIKKRSQQLYEICLISLHCGLRVGEVFKLEWGNINFSDRKIAILDTKTKINKFVNMTTEVEKVLQSKKTGRPEELIFTGRQNKQITSISNTFDRVVEEMKLNEGITDDRNKVVPHTLRHTFASWLVINGEPLYTVSKLLGHSSLEVTQRYAHLAPENFKSAIEKIDDIWEED